MTVLTTNQRLHLRRLLTSLRPTWHDAGTDAAIMRLEQTCNTPAQVLVTAIQTACNLDNTKPEAMNQQAVTTALPIPTAIRTGPRQTCNEHPDAGWRYNGKCAGCWADEQGGSDRPVFDRPVIAAERFAEFRELAGVPSPVTCHPVPEPVDHNERKA